MKLKRNMQKYLYIYYLPSGLFVVVSWASFLIPPEVVPGRMAMLITLFLVLINIFNIVTSNSPNVEGMTAIAAWMLVCIFFVFGALVGKLMSLSPIQSEMFLMCQAMPIFCGRRRKVV